MKPKFFLPLLFCLLAGLFAGARSLPPTNGEETTSKSDLAGGVIHSITKKPIVNVTVTAYLASKEKVVITDGNGNYSFNDLKPGMYKFVFEKDGFKKVVKERVQVYTDEAFQMNVELNEFSEFGFTPNPSSIFDFE